MGKETFLEFVQQHERVWGTDSYPGRPTLEQLLASPVVAFWEPIEAQKSIRVLSRYTATLHKNLDEVEGQIFKLLFRSHIDPPKKRIAHLFRNQNRVRVKSVRIVFEEEK